MNKRVKLEESWKQRLLPEIEKDYMIKLRAFLKSEMNAGKKIFPPASLYFNALNSTPFDQVKVVILGQDPYHGDGQAHGLCFSVAPGVQAPPSLKNIFKELNNDLGVASPNHGYLKSWAEQGVLLLNSVLSVEASKAGSHQNMGWETFTDKIIEIINAQKEHVVFLLWGSYAQKKGSIVDGSRHLVLTSVHPSPLSAHRGFFGQHHFSQANAYLEKHGQKTINWSLSNL